MLIEILDWLSNAWKRTGTPQVSTVQPVNVTVQYDVPWDQGTRGYANRLFPSKYYVELSDVSVSVSISYLVIPEEETRLVSHGLTSFQVGKWSKRIFCVESSRQEPSFWTEVTALANRVGAHAVGDPKNRSAIRLTLLEALTSLAPPKRY